MNTWKTISKEKLEGGTISGFVVRVNQAQVSTGAMRDFITICSDDKFYTFIPPKAIDGKTKKGDKITIKCGSISAEVRENEKGEQNTSYFLENISDLDRVAGSVKITGF